MTDYFYDMDLVVDPLNTSNVVASGQVAIYDPADTTGTTLLALKDPTGLPLPNPLTSNANGFLPPRIAQVPQTMWKSGGYTGYFNSYKGLRDEAVGAVTAAQGAANSAATAAAQVVTTAAVNGSGKLILTKATGATVDAGSVIGPVGPQGDKGLDGANVLPTQEAIEQAITNPGPAKTALNATILTTAQPRQAPMNITPAALVRGYDAMRNVYNLKSSNVRRFRAAFTAAQFAGGVCRIAATGDSQVGGTGADAGTQAWPRLLGDRLLTRGWPLAARGGIAIAYKETAADLRYTKVGGAWPSFVVNATTITGVVQANNTTPLTYTSTTTGTIVEVCYLKGSSAFTVAVDGGAPATVTPESGSGFGFYRVTGLTNATHTVVLTPSVANVQIAHITVLDTSGLAVMNAGIGGSRASQWQSSLAYAAKQQVKAWAPHLVTVGLGTNDKIANRTTAEFKADMSSIIADYKAASDVIITTPVNGNGLDLTGYRAALYELADQHDVPIFDVGDRFGTNAEASANGVMVDAYHITKGANLDVAMGLASLLVD